MIERRYGKCDVTITFKGSNPKLKEEILALLCDSFESRIMNKTEDDENDENDEPHKKES